MAYQYDREDMHEALLRHAKSGYDGLNYTFYPFDLANWKEGPEGYKSPLQSVTTTFNKAGFHVHAFSMVAGGFDLWVERQHIANRWGDFEVNRDYRQTELPTFEEDVK